LGIIRPEVHMLPITKSPSFPRSANIAKIPTAVAAALIRIIRRKSKKLLNGSIFFKKTTIAPFSESIPKCAKSPPKNPKPSSNSRTKISDIAGINWSMLTTDINNFAKERAEDYSLRIKRFGSKFLVGSYFLKILVYTRTYSHVERLFMKPAYCANQFSVCTFTLFMMLRHLAALTAVPTIFKIMFFKNKSQALTSSRDDVRIDLSISIPFIGVYTQS
jgi:uncharacterized protein (DUF2132 family)